MKLAASLQQCLKGDHKAFEPIVLHFEQRVFGLLYTLTGSVEDARDLTQDTSIRAWRRLDQYDPERAFAPWVLTIARNLYREHMRRAGKFSAVEVMLDEESHTLSEYNAGTATTPS